MCQSQLQHHSFGPTLPVPQPVPSFASQGTCRIRDAVPEAVSCDADALGGLVVEVKKEDFWGGRNQNHACDVTDMKR